MVFLMSWLGPATALLVLEEFLEDADSGGDEGDLAEEVGLEDGEGDYSEEQRDESGELQLQKGEDGHQLLELLLLLATAWWRKWGD